MVTANDYATRVFNGDVGVVWRERGTVAVYFCGNSGSVRAISPARLPTVETAWAMTVHKSQGSEFDDVLVVMPERQGRTMNRELLYTAVTRAKRGVTVMGSAGAMRAAVERVTGRMSGLRLDLPKPAVPICRTLAFYRSPADRCGPSMRDAFETSNSEADMPSVEDTTMKVQRILTGPMNLSVSVSKDRFTVRFNQASTTAYIAVREWGTDKDGEMQTIVLITSPILLDVTPTPELYEWVARRGGSRWFGHVEVHSAEKEGEVNLLMSHTLLGDYLDPKELEHGLYQVQLAADEWDDELKARFGGRRLIED
jgi:hypothetical protein